MVALGVFIAYSLNVLDEQYDLSNKLIDCLRMGLKEQLKISEWNARHTLYEGVFHLRDY